MKNRYYIENGTLKSFPLQEQTGLKLKVYEVLRVIGGVALFAEDHLERFLNSCALSGIGSPLEFVQFLEQLQVIIETNSMEIGNLKFDLSILESGKFVWQMYPIAHQYPAEIDYSTGVRCGLLPLERANPQAKVVQQTVREQANATIAANNWYEAILVNARGCITEGSRSNIFFIKKERVYTAPAAQVLLGITRAKVMDCISTLELICSEVPIALESLASFDAAFISGTSPKILPIAQIEGIPFDVNNPVLRRLMEAYDQLISSYILERKPTAGEV